MACGRGGRSPEPSAERRGGGAHEREVRQKGPPPQTSTDVTGDRGGADASFPHGDGPTDYLEVQHGMCAVLTFSAHASGDVLENSRVSDTADLQQSGVCAARRPAAQARIGGRWHADVLPSIMQGVSSAPPPSAPFLHPRIDPVCGRIRHCADKDVQRATRGARGPDLDCWHATETTTPRVQIRFKRRLSCPPVGVPGRSRLRRLGDRACAIRNWGSMRGRSRVRHGISAARSSCVRLRRRFLAILSHDQVFWSVRG